MSYSRRGLMAEFGPSVDDEWNKKANVANKLVHFYNCNINTFDTETENESFAKLIEQLIDEIIVIGPKTISKPIGANLPVSTAVLTKRELIAAMALQGLLSNEHVVMEWQYELIVEESVKNADNLLKKLS